MHACPASPSNSRTTISTVSQPGSRLSLDTECPPPAGSLLSPSIAQPHPTCSASPFLPSQECKWDRFYVPKLLAVSGQHRSLDTYQAIAGSEVCLSPTESGVPWSGHIVACSPVAEDNLTSL